MKKGLLIYKAKRIRKNIGDYIQSIAAEQYTGRDVVFVEREHTHEYTGEPLQLIMNGWFMHIPENWPPSENIVPLLTSVHINPDISGKMLGEKGMAYLKKHGPVGCRDKGTERLLKSKGIPAYFSGCLTLTLGKTYKHNPKTENICFVDVHHDITMVKNPLTLLAYLFTMVSKRKTIATISRKLNKSTSFRKLLRASQFYHTYSRVFEDEVLEKAEYVKHMIPESTFESEESKLACARNLLNKYANSKLVVTSRIHAALPCLAMNTPVIFILSDDLRPGGKGLQPEARGRFEGLLDLLHVMEYYDYRLKPILGFNLDKKIGLNHSIRNKQNHLKIAEELDKTCTAFVNNLNQSIKEVVHPNV